MLVNRKQSEFLNMFINVPQKIRFTDQILPGQDVVHIDIKSGYTQHQNLPLEYRRGFGILTDLRYVDDVNFAIQYNGLYVCKIEWKNNKH